MNFFSWYQLFEEVDFCNKQFSFQTITVCVIRFPLRCFFMCLYLTTFYFLFCSCCPEPYPDITFYVHMRRIPGFFLFNIIIPCMVVTSFSVLTFAFPPESGERVTLVIESFLAMSVVILNVSDSIPVTSDATPIIVKILLAAMFQIGGTLVANCISLNSYKKTEMPQWVRVFFLHYLARMLCINTGHPKANVRSTRRVDVKVLRLLYYLPDGC